MSEHENINMPTAILVEDGIDEYTCKLTLNGNGTYDVHINAPTEPVVRCRDCTKAEYPEVHMLDGSKRHVLTCMRFQCYQHETQPDGFCAWGERRVD